MGAAELAGATCRCCCIELDHSAARRIANTPLSRPVTCPECGVLLLRTGE
jgi:predicted  nucleic acid-binding Zn-ribbon protein